MRKTRRMSRLYTRPRLRERLKQKIKEGSRGGPQGRWSARKSAVLKHEYEQAGGGYTKRRRMPKQRRLKRQLSELNRKERKG